jgi:SAM-dependent methyltransferase
MIPEDEAYFRRCHRLGLVTSPLLEVGSAKIDPQAVNLCDVARALGVRQTVGVDLRAGHGVDAVRDFALAPDEFRRTNHGQIFSTVAMFNVLEHTFDPTTVLDNALACVAPGGSLLVSSPVVWPLHEFPRDYVRLLPQWYEEYARRRGIKLRDDAFCWLSQFGVTDVRRLKYGSQYVLPTYRSLGSQQSLARYWVSRVVHRLFRTYGHSHWFTHSSIGAALINVPSVNRLGGAPVQP